jgi:hypothetical protein
MSKQPNAQPVKEDTDTSCVEPEVIAPEPKPLTIDERLAMLEKNWEIAAANFTEIQKAFVSLQQTLTQLGTSMQQRPAAGGDATSTLAEVAKLLPEVLKGGGGDNSLMNQLAMESLRADIDFTKTLKNAVMSKLISPTAQKVAEAVVPE